jgi:hypothetical protein
MIKLVPAGAGTAPIVYPKYGLTQAIPAGGGGTPVAAAAANFVTSEAVMLQPTVTVHFHAASDGSLATPSDPIVWAGDTAFFGARYGQKISIIKRTGEPDGEVLVTDLESV